MPFLFVGGGEGVISVLRVHSCWESGCHMGSRGLNSDLPCARQEPYPLVYHSGPNCLTLFKGNFAVRRVQSRIHCSCFLEGTLAPLRKKRKVHPHAWSRRGAGGAGRAKVRCRRGGEARPRGLTLSQPFTAAPGHTLQVTLGSQRGGGGRGGGGAGGESGPGCKRPSDASPRVQR